jgi:hypothetical protein
MIHLYNKNGKLVMTFKTQAEVAEHLEKSKAAVSKAINGKLKYINDYVVSREDFMCHVTKHNIPIDRFCYKITQLDITKFSSEKFRKLESPTLYCQSVKKLAEILEVPVLKAIDFAIHDETLDGVEIIQDRHVIEDMQLFIE